MAVNNLDLARVYSAGEQIKGLRSQNALAQMTMKNKQEFSALAPKIAAGDRAATLAGAAIAPQDTTAIMSAVSKMGETDRARMKANYEEIGKAAAWADTPEKWTQAIDFLNSKAGGGFEQYRGQFASREMIINNIREVSDILGGKGDAFTLSQGQTRFGPDGKPVASVAAAKDAAGQGRKTAKDRAGVLRYLDDGSPVFDQAAVSAAAPPDVRDPEKVFGQEGKLRAEFATATKAFTTVRDSYARIQASAEDPSAAGDLALIFNYMKVLDPGSTVREGEFATAQNAAGVPERVQAFYNNVMRGERMTPVQRDDFVDRSGRLYESQLSQYKNTETRYRDLASKYQGVDPERVVYDVTGGLTVPAPPATDVTDLPEGDIKETKTIGGKTYVRIGEDWFEQ